MPESEAIQMVRNCTAPWRSLDALSKADKKREFISTDTKEQMMKCFNCRKKVCDNCVAHSGKEEIRQLFRKYYYEGLSRAEICRKMNICRATYWNYKKKFLDEEGE